MRLSLLVAAATAAWLAAVCSVFAVEAAQCRLFEGKQRATICLPPDAPPVIQHAAQLLKAAIEQLGGPQAKVSIEEGEQGDIILCTLSSGRGSLLGPEASALGDEAYLAKVVPANRGGRLILLGGSPPGVLYGAARLADLGLKVEAGGVVIEADGKPHQPALALRGNYTLACWGKTHLWTRQDWCHVLDAMAADSMNVVLLWLSGLFPSQRYPASVVYPETRISLNDIRAMIRHAHQRGMRFLIGSGVFAWFGMDALAKQHPETRAVGSGGMCPSNPLARKLNREYLLEMLEALPEADGLFLEIRDEYGPCTCRTCQKPLDQHGSREYGQAELSFLRQFAEELWRRNGRAIIVSSIGYGAESRGAHTGDVMFYDGIRRMDDQRLFWMVCRDNWELPGPGAQPKPLRWFSPNMVQWTQYYRLSAGEIGTWIRRSRDAGCVGFTPAFEPGFCSASWYSDEIPYPVDRIPYLVTRFAYREYCWDPDMTEAQFRARLLRRFFGSGAPTHLADDLLALFDVIRRESQNRRIAPEEKWPRGCMVRLLDEAQKASSSTHSLGALAKLQQRLRSLSTVGDQHREPLAQIEHRVRQAMPRLDPRGRQTAGLMLRALADTRTELCLEAEAQTRLQNALVHLETEIERLQASAPFTVTATSEWNDTTYGAFRAFDGDVKTSWLCEDRAPLPQSITIALRRKRTVGLVKLVQGTYHRAYNTRAFRVEASTDGKTFTPLFEGELENRPGAVFQKSFTPTEASAVRVVVLSVYPNVEYSAPSLAEIDLGLDLR